MPQHGNAHFLCARIFLVVIAAFGLCSSTPAATLLEIQLGGVDIGYDGTNISDADPGDADPDPLTTVTFVVDGVMIGSVFTSDIALDLFIPDVLGIDDTGDTVTSAAGGAFSLSLPGGGFLNLTLDAATITYVNISNAVQFVFGGSIGDITGQSLPYGLAIDDPVTVSFSTPINPGSLVTSAGTVDAFTASGTGEVRGPLVPEPTSFALLALTLSMAAVVRRR